MLKKRKGKKLIWKGGRLKERKGKKLIRRKEGGRKDQWEGRRAAFSCVGTSRRLIDRWKDARMQGKTD
jgi:hypothetical protein